MKWLKLSIFLTVLFIFFYLRLTPIINQTVPYTYDQGRDFLKAEEIIRNGNFTFIGPTTGIQGVYHGAWWYYILTIFYLFFNGLPIGFYYGLFILSTIAMVLFYFFIKKEFGWQTSLLFLLIITTGNFFIKLAFFTSNNTLSPLFVLLLIYSVYQFLKTKLNKYLFLISFSLGFIFEFEVASGILITISFFITSLFFKLFRKSYINLRKLVFFLSGIIIPISPRLLFELKNNFIQTKAFINFYIHPVATNQSSFFSTLTERTQLFLKYYLQLISQEKFYLGALFFLFFIYLFIKGRKNAKKKNTLLFFSLLTVVIFLVSLINRNNFFWDYYLDGVQFIILFIFILIFNLENRLQFVKNILLGTFIFIMLISFSKDLSNINIPLIGLRADDKIVRYFVEKSNNKYFCLRIYTPPVIPFTYYYLFSYYANHQKIKYPRQEFTNNQCYFIFDKESYQFRVDKWREQYIPKNSELNKIIKFENGTSVELWTLTKN
ncbi:MAG: hypothetical protein AAB437_01605 [Patescibacteria group bacterium]